MSPYKLSLPSGRRVTLEARGSSAPDLLAVLDAFADGTFEARDEAGKRIPPEQLALGDFHVLRALLTARGHLPEPAVTRPCINCQKPLTMRPCQGLELGPFLDDELDDPELDRPFPFAEGGPHPRPLSGNTGEGSSPRSRGAPAPSLPAVLPSPAPLSGISGEGRGGEEMLAQLAPVTAAGARALFEALGQKQLRITSAVVRAMGVVRLGDETHPGRIARALQRASDAEWGAVVDRFDQAHYAARLQGWTRCEGCKARNAFEAPAIKEFPADSAPPAATTEPFLSFERFSLKVERHASRIFKARGLRNVGLVVDDDVPACDEGGVPLLGSYDPPVPEQPGMPARPPEVRLYYRTFEAMHREEGPYDVDAEILETLEHELEHHVSYLGGDDPQDDLEHEEIAEEARRVIGDTESLRRSSKAIRSGLGDFLYRTWPLWVIAFGGFLLSLLAER